MSTRKFSEYVKLRFQEEILREAEVQDTKLKQAIQDALGDMSQGREESYWMNLNTKNFSHDLQDIILGLGEVKRRASPEKLLDIRKSVRKGVTIRELISMIADEGGPHLVHDDNVEERLPAAGVPFSIGQSDFETV